MHKNEWGSGCCDKNPSTPKFLAGICPEALVKDASSEFPGDAIPGTP